MTVILLRHGRSSANTAATLAGRTPGVGLDETGRAQAAEAARRLGGLPIVAIVSSPQQRCKDTVRPLSEAVEQHLQRYFDLHGDQLPPPGLYERVLREVERPLIQIALDASVSSCFTRIHTHTGRADLLSPTRYRRS